MGLKGMLARMKLVELESEGPAVPAGSDLAEVIGAVPPPYPIESIERSIDRPVDPDAIASEPIPDFAEIYRAAGLADPAHGFTAIKVLEILSAPEFSSLAPKAKAAALAGFLKMNPAGPVPIADVIQDAVRRDQALDQFERFLRSQLAERTGHLDAENAALQAQIDRNRAALDAERRRLEEWLAKKRAEERRLADAVAPFVEEPPISIGS